MANYRGWIWSLVAVAGTATVVAVAYRYATRSARDHGDEQTAVAREGEEGEEVDYDWPSEDEEEELGSDGQQSEQQLQLVAREGNMENADFLRLCCCGMMASKVLAMFGLMLMLLVTAVSLVITWGSEEDASFTELPMFQPLMWIAVGIFTAASMELLTRSAGTSSEVPVLEEKAVFPHDESDFELIRQHDGKCLVSFCDHIQRAIELDPSDATSHNILGQWCLAFADMTWIEKRAAAALFGTPPTATYEEAVQHFQAAGNGLTYFSTRERISPGFWKKNAFLLAQTYMKMKRTSEASKWVLQANGVPVKTKEDEEVQKDIASLMKQLSL
ncbi:hypothetical protein BBJ28_00012315 [Nothophytophthora sp. Chile5]|nr:hypothetical protein BBJ28_00012315 [Nothophytophthora sp. Chile5]